MRKIPIFRAALQSQQDLTFSTFPPTSLAPLRYKREKSLIKDLSRRGHVEGYHQNSPGFLGAFLPHHRFLPPVHLILGPWLTLMVFLSSFII
jgi:hypothetical protein